MKRQNATKMGGAVLVLLVASMGVASAQTPMNVQVREAHLRERPSYLGAVSTTLEYGDAVVVEREQGPWRYVSAPTGQGWIHESALTRQRVALTSGGADVQTGATTGEMALAGKGFSAGVENEFRTKNRTIDFTWVDYMEKLALPPARLSRFMHEGGLGAPEGGR
jgi:hypothetical protein